MAGRRSKTERGEEATIRVAFRVPMDFAFAWCTDYTPEDASLEGETYQRKIIERSPRRVVFEDLEETDSGWVWGRDVVTLRPPDRWSMKGVGNRRNVEAEYRLSKPQEGTTQLELRWWRLATPLGKNIPRAQREAEATRAWKKFGAAMEQDYRRSRSPNRGTK